MKKNKKIDSTTVTDRQPSPYMLWLITISMLMIVIATIMPLIMPGNVIFKYIYAIGAGLLFIGRLFTPYRGDILRIKRLYRIEGWSSIIFCVAAFFLFYQEANGTDWLGFTLAGGILQVYTSIMIPRAITKAQRENKQ